MLFSSIGRVALTAAALSAMAGASSAQSMSTNAASFNGGYARYNGQENRANEPISELDSQNNIIFNARPGSRIALLGVDDLIIVQTPDALLIANRHQADAIKKLSDILPVELL